MCKIILLKETPVYLKLRKGAAGLCAPIFGSGLHFTSDPGVKDDDRSGAPAADSSSAGVVFAGRKRSSNSKSCPGRSFITSRREDDAVRFCRRAMFGPTLLALLVVYSQPPRPSPPPLPLLLLWLLSSRVFFILRQGGDRFAANGPRVSKRKKTGVVEGLLRLTCRASS